MSQERPVVYMGIGNTSTPEIPQTTDAQPENQGTDVHPVENTQGEMSVPALLILYLLIVLQLLEVS